MKISDRFKSLFNNKDCLLLVAGRQGSEVYLVNGDELKKIRSIHIHKPKYSDKEGSFQKRSGRQLIKTGSSYEYPKEVIKYDFLKELKSLLKKLAQTEHISALYLTVPAYMANEVERILPPPLYNLARSVIHGNFMKEPITTILERFKAANRSVFIKFAPT